MAVDLSLASESHFFVGLNGDLTTGGVFVATYRPLAVGAFVDVELALPTASVRVRGTVRWVREACEGTAPGLGIGLEELPDEDRARVAAFCSQRAPLYYDLDDAV
jgi:uncharacterized protein (TIGR02266 family)